MNFLKSFKLLLVLKANKPIQTWFNYTYKQIKCLKSIATFCLNKRKILLDLVREGKCWPWWVLHLFPVSWHLLYAHWKRWGWDEIKCRKYYRI